MAIASPSSRDIEGQCPDGRTSDRVLEERGQRTDAVLHGEVGRQGVSAEARARPGGPAVRRRPPPRPPHSYRSISARETSSSSTDSSSRGPWHATHPTEWKSCPAALDGPASLVSSTIGFAPAWTRDHGEERSQPSATRRRLAPAPRRADAGDVVPGRTALGPRGTRRARAPRLARPRRRGRARRAGSSRLRATSESGA